MAGIGYDMAPTLMTWQIERYLPLRSDQKALVERHLVQFHEWHRASQLPRYSKALVEIDDRFRGNADLDSVKAVRSRLPEFWGPVAERLATPMAELLLTMDTAQIEAMKKKVAQANAKQRKEFAGNNPRERDAARIKRLQERSEFFLGDLTDQQLSQLKKLAADLPPSQEAWMQEREARQQRFFALAERIVAQRPAREMASRWSAEFLSSMWVSQDNERRAVLDTSSLAGDMLTLKMFQQASPEQRQFLSEKLRAYAKDLNNWARPRGTDTARSVPTNG